MNKDETSDPDFSEDQKVTKRTQDSKKSQQKTEVDNKKQDAQPKRSNFVTRTIYTLLMLGGFFVIIAAGSLYATIFVSFLQLLMFSELMGLKRRKDKERAELPYFHYLHWYFFVIVELYNYVKLFQYKLPTIAYSIPFFDSISTRILLIFFILWSAGFVTFVLSLKQGYYKYQIRQFGWAHLGCLFILGSTSLMQNNLYEGMVWFLLPATLVIANDIFAYIFGFFMGKTKLISLSPKKTWEGFIGGAVCSVIWAFLIALVVTYIPQLVCPQRTIHFLPFNFESCTFPYYYDFYEVGFLGLSMQINDFSLHAMVLSLFASLIAPFGGFFASGFKRALKIKDFGDVIPGHGGLIDRFDCQLIMGIFAYLYLHYVVLYPQNRMANLISYVNQLDVSDQLALYESLKINLSQTGLI